MFRNIVSNLPFSPALVGQLGFYAKRLKKEESTRRIGLIFTALALVVQSFAVFSPPTAVNASSSADFVRGGVSSVNDFLKSYDKNNRHIKDLFTSLGITRSEIKAAKSGTVGKRGYYNWSMTSLYSHSQGQRSYKFYTSSGSSDTVYYRPMSLTKTGRAPYPVYIGHSKTFGWFAIKKDCGNLITNKQPPAAEKPKPEKPAPTPVATCSNLSTRIIGRNNVEFTGAATASGGASINKYTFVVKNASGKTVAERTVNSSRSSANTEAIVFITPGEYSAHLTVSTSLGNKTDSNDCVSRFTIVPPAVCPVKPTLLATDPECQPCPGDSNIWIKDQNCSADVMKTKSAVNLTQARSDASKDIARSSDRVAYTVNVENRGLISSPVTIEEQLEDVLEYAKLVDNGGGTYDKRAKTLAWPTVNLGAGEKQSRTFVVQIKSDIPATNTGTSNGTSFDCTMTNTFGNSVDVNVDCPIEKVIVEQVVGELPHTGPRENMLFAAAVLSVVAYFYARSLQVNKEVRLIRRDLNAGTI